MPGGPLPNRGCVGSKTLNIKGLGRSQNQQRVEAFPRPKEDEEEVSPYHSLTGRFGNPCIVVRRKLEPTDFHNSLQDTLDWSKIDCHDFLRLAREVPAEDLFDCITTDKTYSRTGERGWDLSEFVLQRKDRRIFIGGQGVVMFVRRQGHSTSLAMKVCYHRRDEKRVERQVQRTILHLKAQGVSQFVGKVLVNYLTRRFFITIMPKAKYASLKSLKEEVGTLSEASIRYYFACITSALLKLHSIQICHRDVKCDNVLIMHNGTPALIDFGLASKGSMSYEEFKPNSRITQMQYYPPETKHLGALVNNYKIDSWLLGFFLCEMIISDREHLWTKFRNSSTPDYTFALCSVCQGSVAPVIATLLSQLLLRDPKERMHVAEVAYDSYLQDSNYFSEIETAEPPQHEVPTKKTSIVISQELE